MANLRIIQLNGQRASVVPAQLKEKIVSEGISIALLQEPYCAFGSVRGYSGMRVCTKPERGQIWAAIVARKNIDLMYLHGLSSSHIVVACVDMGWGTMYLISAYRQFREPLQVCLLQLQEILRTLEGKHCLIAIDANARSPEWHDRVLNHDGREMEDFISTHDLVILNRRGQPTTFWRPDGESNPDLTLCTSEVSQYVRNWTIRADWTTSDHRVIELEVSQTREPIAPYAGRFRFDKTDWERANNLISRYSFGLDYTVTSPAQVDSLSTKITSDLLKLSNEVAVTTSTSLRANPWWTQQLSAQRASVNRARKRFQSSRRRNLQGEQVDAHKREYNRLKNEYTQAIRKAKLDHWREFVETEGNENVWGMVYKIVTEKLPPCEVDTSIRAQNGVEQITRAASSVELVRALFPRDDPSSDSALHREVRARLLIPPNTGVSGEFSEAELTAALKTIRPRSAAGEDRIENTLILHLARTEPPIVLRLMNLCLRFQVFPASWKSGKVKLLTKTPDSDRTDPKSYRPICLLSTMGKLLERLLLPRLRDAYQASGLAAPEQYGFRIGKCTVDAIARVKDFVTRNDGHVAAITVDISGAFDNLWWPSIFDRLKSMNCPRDLYGLILSYFSDREVALQVGGHVARYTINRGCPQGSVCGPFFWNLVFDGAVHLKPDEEGLKVAYADDLIVLAAGDSRAQLQRRLQRMMDNLAVWCDQNKLTISKTKTKGILLKGTLRSNPVVRLTNRSIGWVTQTKYLGVMIDRGLTFLPHAKYMEVKIKSIARKFYRVCRSTWGLRRRALGFVYQSVFLGLATYAAPVWYERASNAHVRRSLESAQRAFILLFVRSYRTAPTEALQVLSGCLPLDLEVVYAALRTKLRRGEGIDYRRLHIEALERGLVGAERTRAIRANETTLMDWLMDEWQARWTASGTGRTLHNWIPDVRFARDAAWFRPTAATVCFLTGHGPFRAYLHRFDIGVEDRCECGEPETSEHVLRYCNLYAQTRASSGVQDFAAVMDSEESFERFQTLCMTLYELAKIRNRNVRNQ